MIGPMRHNFDWQEIYRKAVTSLPPSLVHAYHISKSFDKGAHSHDHSMMRLISQLFSLSHSSVCWTTTLRGDNSFCSLKKNAVPPIGNHIPQT